MEKKEDEIFCSHCGKVIKKEAEICVGCGIRQHKTLGKDKTVAILLAVFLGFWTWLYTYKKDAWKFWLNLGLAIITLCFYGIAAWISAIYGFAAWIWAIIDTSTKPEYFYIKINNEKKYEENLTTNSSCLSPNKSKAWKRINLAYSILSLLTIATVSLVGVLVFVVIGEKVITSPESFKLPAQDIFSVTSVFIAVLIILVIFSIIQLVFAIKEYRSTIKFRNWVVANSVSFLFYSAILVYFSLKELNSLLGCLSVIFAAIFFYLLKSKSEMKIWTWFLMVFIYLVIVISVKLYFSLM